MSDPDRDNVRPGDAAITALAHIERLIILANAATALSTVLWAVPITLVAATHLSHSAITVLVAFAVMSSTLSATANIVFRAQRGGIHQRSRDEAFQDQLVELVSGLHVDTMRQLVRNRQVADAAIETCATLLQQMSAKIDRTQWDFYADALEDLQSVLVEDAPTQALNERLAKIRNSGSVIPMVRSSSLPGRSN